MNSYWEGYFVSYLFPLLANGSFWRLIVRSLSKNMSWFRRHPVIPPEVRCFRYILRVYMRSEEVVMDVFREFQVMSQVDLRWRALGQFVWHDTRLKTKSSPLKIDAWKSTFPLKWSLSKDIPSFLGTVSNFFWWRWGCYSKHSFWYFRGRVKKKHGQHQFELCRRMKCWMLCFWFNHVGQLCSEEARESFWSHIKSFQPWRDHPVFQQDGNCFSKIIPVPLHADGNKSMYCREVINNPPALYISQLAAGPGWSEPNNCEPCCAVDGDCIIGHCSWQGVCWRRVCKEFV